MRFQYYTINYIENANGSLQSTKPLYDTTTRICGFDKFLIYDFIGRWLYFTCVCEYKDE